MGNGHRMAKKSKPNNKNGNKPTNRNNSSEIQYQYVVNWKDLDDKDQWEIVEDLGDLKFFLVVLTQHGIKNKNIYVGKVANVRKVKQLAEFIKISKDKPKRKKKSNGIH